MSGGNVQSSSGVCAFPNVRIKISGTYTLKVNVAEAGVVEKKSGEFTVTSSIVSVTILPNANYIEYTAYFLYNFVVVLKGEGNYDYLEGATIVLTADTSLLISGITSIDTTTSSQIFNDIFFKYYGSGAITATATHASDASKYGTLLITVKNLVTSIQAFTVLFI